MKPEQYAHINKLISRYSEICAQIEEAEASIKRCQLDSAQELLPTHAQLKVQQTAVEEELRGLTAAHHRELFPEEDKRNHKTPFGTLQFHRSSSLEFDDEEKVLLKIKLACQKEADHAQRTGAAARFTQEQLIRTKEMPNLEVIGTFDGPTIALFGITREEKDNFKVVPFTMKADKPAKASKVKEAA